MNEFNLFIDSEVQCMRMLNDNDKVHDNVEAEGEKLHLQENQNLMECRVDTPCKGYLQ